MATFLQICQTVDTLSGVQGSISDTQSTLGLQTVIVTSVQEAWLFIQNYRKTWSFMKDSTYFNTVPGQEVYTPAEVFINSNPDFLGVYLEEGMFHENRLIPYVEAADYPFIDNTDEGQLFWWTDVPSNNYLKLSLPDDVYRIDVYYSRNPQILTLPTDVPNLPERFHQLITYKALELFGNHLGNFELEAKSAQTVDVLMGALMREFIVQKTARLHGGIA